MQEFAEQYVENLEPQDARYDTRLGDDFYICTFPNGVKTWIYVYEVNGYKRRRTLGVYPEMTLTDARETLFAARKLQHVEATLLAQGLTGEVTRSGGGGTKAPSAGQNKARSTRLRLMDARFAGGAALGAVITLAALFVPGLLDRPGSSGDGSTAPSLAEVRTAPDPDVANGSEPSPSATAVTAEPLPEADVEPAQPQVAELSSAPASPAAASAEPAPAGNAATPQAPPPDPTTMKLQAALAGTVAREALTSAVEDKQPVDDIQEPLTLTPPEPSRVFYFTEVRGMAGQRLVHRWLHAGNLVAHVPLTVADGWRSAVFSSTEIAPEMTGRWRVVLENAEGEAIESHEFTVQHAEPSLAASLDQAP